MLIRIVRMTFKPDAVETFKELFQKSEKHIRSFEGCAHLELLKDYDHEHVYYTHSHWKDGAALDNYRKSEFFGEVWKSTKILFDEKPMAFSLFKDDHLI